MRIAWLAAAVALAAASSVAAGSDPAELLPGDDFLPGWKRVESLSRYRGAELYGHIDGGAEIFLELGFEQAVVQEYAAGGDELVVEVYAMSDQVAAAGAYLLKCGAEQHHPAIPGRHAFTPRQVLLYRDSFYLVLYAFTSGEASTAAMIAAAGVILQHLPGEQPLPHAHVLPNEGRVERSLRLLRGPFTLQKVFTLGDGDVLSLGGSIPAVAADYEDGRGGTYSRIAAIYPDRATALAAFEHLAGALDGAITRLERSEHRVAFRDWNGRYGDAVVSDARIELRVNLPELPSPD